MKRILVSGVSGFVGQRFLSWAKDKYIVDTVSLRTTAISDIDWEVYDVVLHLAGKAHQMQKIDEQIYFNVNFHLTKDLATKAKKQGVKQFIFISTTKVYGDSIQDRLLNEQSPCIPTDAYGESKLKAEQALLTLEDSNFIVSIIRPPLIYGMGVKGNMLRLLELSNKRYPLPFKAINNKRSMVYIDNLIALIHHTITLAASGLFIAGDKSPISTSYLIEHIYRSQNKKLNWFKVPPGMRFILKKIRPSIYQRLFGSFVIDNNISNKQLNFVPPYSTEYGIEEMVKWFVKEKK